ncbi:DNA-binding response regulator [Flavipsychrobacter stenotrophus]|uniref:DNA-binding response regulator n=1 Tax=Flavipsychrobacter stenotrophus TaxID=2077091 RepID=A0A2S7SZF5_9BACT|nr:LytTR family DNA-binding domain-containing protein [Flavipsychrobacter stenotrophus]PQJ12078.1 DNA-binding response regulator [Flavipsychrobacter stenotrophus]
MIKVVIIDDEKSAVTSIELSLKEYCHGVEVVGKAYTAADGISQIEAHKPDLVFLDIEMPHMTGIELLEHMGDRSFEVIFVTAYNEYAVKAFKLNAIDYLLKPVSIPELIKAVNKVREKTHTEGSTDDKIKRLRETLSGKIGIPFSTGTEFVKITDIIRIEAEGSYSKVITNDGKTRLISRSLKEMQTALHDERFFRTHKSHLINIEYIKKYSPLKDGGDVEMADGAHIEIARACKQEFALLLNNIFR